MPLIVQANQFPSNQRQRREVKKFCQFLLKQFIPACRLTLNVNDIEFHPEIFMDDLAQEIFSFNKSGAVNLMTVNDCLQRLLQCIDVQLASKGEPGIEAVGQIAGFHLVNEPDTLL